MTTHIVTKHFTPAFSLR